MARLIEGALNEVSPGLVVSAQSIGATPWQIIRKVLVPEARGGIITGLTITLVTLVSYSAMAGAVGGGGLGDLGIVMDTTVLTPHHYADYRDYFGGHGARL